MDTINNELISWLKKTKIPLSVISRETGISRKSLHNWKTGGIPSVSSMGKLSEYYSKKERSNTVPLNNKGKIDSDYVISLQKDILDRVEADNKRLKEEVAMNKTQSVIWENLEHHCFTTIELKMKQEILVNLHSFLSIRLLIYGMQKQIN